MLQPSERTHPCHCYCHLRTAPGIIPRVGPGGVYAGQRPKWIPKPSPAGHLAIPPTLSKVLKVLAQLPWGPCCKVSQRPLPCHPCSLSPATSLTQCNSRLHRIPSPRTDHSGTRGSFLLPPTSRPASAPSGTSHAPLGPPPSSPSHCLSPRG